MKRLLLSTLLAAGAMLLGPGHASAVSIGFSAAGANDVDVVVTGLGSEVVSAYDMDILYDPTVALWTDVIFADALGVSNVDTFADFAFLNPDPTGGVLDVTELSFLSDAELAAIQGDPLTLFTISFDGPMDPATLDVGYIDVKGRNNEPIIPSSVPEPSTWLLMGVGLAGLWGGSRRIRG